MKRAEQEEQGKGSKHWRRKWIEYSRRSREKGRKTGGGNEKSRAGGAGKRVKRLEEEMERAEQEEQGQIRTVLTTIRLADSSLAEGPSSTYNMTVFSMSSTVQ